MSNAVISAVWNRSRSEGTARLVLLSIADRADEKGRAFCGAKDLCQRANAGRRTIFTALRELKELKELNIMEGKGPRGCNRYEMTDTQGGGPSTWTGSLVAPRSLIGRAA